MGKILEDKEIMIKLLKALDVKARNFAGLLGYKAHASITNIIYSKNNITEELIKRIMERYPNVNHRFLVTGEGYPLTTPPETSYQKAIVDLPPAPTDPLHILSTLASRIENIEKNQTTIMQQNDMILQLLQKQKSGQ